MAPKTKPETENRGGAGRGQGRKPKAEGERRTRRVMIKLTEGEYLAFEAAAEAGETTIAELVRECALETLGGGEVRS